MIELLLVILVSFVVTCLILGIDTIYRVRTDPKVRAEYKALNEKAKQIAKEREEEKSKQPKRRGFFRRLWDSLSDPSSLPEPIRKAMGSPF